MEQTMNQSEQPKRIQLSAGVEFSIPQEPAPLGTDSVVAAAGAGTGEAAKLKSFRMVAYTGGAMDVGFGHPVVVDLAGMKVSSKPRPILLQHNPMLIVGHTESIDVKGLHDHAELRVSGVISGAGDAAQSVMAAAANGFPWQASIGAAISKVEFVDKGDAAEANGRRFKGPVYIARASQLGEVSFVALGADDNTSASVAASAAGNEDSIMAELKAEATTTTAPSAPVVDGAAVTAQIRAEAAAESARIAGIRKVCAGKHGEIEAKAISEGWDSTRAELEVLRAERPVMGAPAAHVKDAELGTEVLEAAICISGRLPGVEKSFSEKSLEAAEKRYRRGLGLQELLLEAAWANGYTGRTVRGNERAVLQAAFSNMAIPGILSSAANKFVLSGFMAVESSWRAVAAIRSVSDFKAAPSYRLNGGFEYDEVSPAGELKHGEASETSYTNQAKTYGKMFSVTRQDIVNDDMGALTALPMRIGRGAAMKLNKVFWSAFLNNSSFFTAGRNNLVTGANSALGVDALTVAEQKFLDQTDPDGNPLGIAPAVLLVPTALNAKAAQLMASTELRPASSAKDVIANPHAGKFSVVYSAYLSNAALTGNSSTAWYLLANPTDIATIEVAFLNGVETPTVETADADFNVLGIQMRGYHDFGVALQEYRAGVKNAGA
jgi:hypothetical protein